MTRIRVPGEKRLYWVGSSFKDLLKFPAKVQRIMGFAFGTAQFGGKHPAAKPWKGEGPGTFEVVADFDWNTYRAVYTVRFPEAVYVLHAFQKKSPHGIATRTSDVSLIRERMRAAQEDYEARYGSKQSN
ncbi:MAG TPA: type II toxin-antitoxin system RelE/ParE family toxin [Terracidiphilus sp.]|nr:type II toxin-antitoxin system RelE/ParE family toxin [Terracidiphilus sp.]